MPKCTHIGIIVGCDARTPDGFSAMVNLRETKNFWITSHKNKYRKNDGSGIGDWPLYSLRIDSIKALVKTGQESGTKSRPQFS